MKKLITLILMVGMTVASFGGITKHQPKKEEQKKTQGSKGLDGSKGL